jgi:hypothetical protein
MTALGMTIAYIAVCAFFTALVFGMWYGMYRYISENLENLKSKNYTFKEKAFKFSSFVVMACIVLAMTGTNLVFWSRTGSIFSELRGHNHCMCAHRD